MIEDLFPKKLFFDRREFKGSLAKHNEIADKIHLVVQYPLIKQGEIVGKAFGDKNTYKKLDRTATLPGPFFRLTYEKHENITSEIYSEKVLIPTIAGRGWPSAYGEGMASEVADLRLEDLFITEHFKHRETQDRHLTFFLAGPRELWSVHHLRVPSFTGEVEIDVRNAPIELDEPFPFDIEVRPIYLYDEAPASGNCQLSADVLALHLKTRKSMEEFSTEKFLALGKELADDLTLLVSFLSRHWVTWFRYQLETNDKIETYVRRTRPCSTKKLQWENGLLEHHRSREFLKTGLRNLRTLRKNGFNLFMPIVYFVSANEKTYLEEQFTTFFLSLERIKDMFAKEENLQKNLPNTAFKRLHSSIGDLVDSQVESPDARDRIRKKILELNRPSLRYVLESLLSKYRVTWEDLYPAAGQLTLIKTRDKLFHSSLEIDIDLLIKERDRLQALLERILLRMLGWDDISRSPVDFIKRWLTAPVKRKPTGQER